MKLHTHLPYRSMEELRQQFEALLRALLAEARAAQQDNHRRCQFVDLSEATAVAWIEPTALPSFVARDGGHYFCIYAQPPTMHQPCGEYLVHGAVERVVRCTCGHFANGECRHTAPEQDTTPHPCQRCELRVQFQVHEFFPLTPLEVLEALHRWFDTEVHAQLTRDVISVGSQIGANGQFGASSLRVARMPQRVHNRPGAPALRSTLQLRDWIAATNPPTDFQQYRQAWEAIRRTEPGWDDILDVDRAFVRTATRCVDQVYKRATSTPVSLAA